MMIKFVKRFWERFIIIAIIAFAIGYLIYSVIESMRWAKETKPYVNNFLELVANNDYDKLYVSYAKDSEIPISSFLLEFSTFHDKFGRITDYEFMQDSKTFNGNKLIGFYMIYKIEFDSGRHFQGNFDIQIDENTNCPIAGKVKGFNFSGGDGKEYQFGMRLIAKE